MDHVNINAVYDINGTPVILSESEIADVLDTLPSIMSPDEDSKILIGDNIKAKLYDVLKVKKVSLIGIGNIVNTMVNMFNSAHVVPGSAVGIHGAEGVSRLPSQMSMDTFKSAGESKSSASSVADVEDLLYVKKNKTNEICTLFYKDTFINYDEVLMSRKDIVECIIEDLLLPDTYIIDSYDNLPKKWWHDAFYIKNILKKPMINESDGTYILRLVFDINMLYKFEITLQEIAEKIEEQEPLYNVYYGPMEDCIMDVQVNLKHVEGKKFKETNMYDTIPAVSTDRNIITDYIEISAFYENKMLPIINKIKIKGINGIKNLTPIVMPILSIIMNEQKLWMFDFNEKDDDVLDLFQLLDIFVYKRLDGVLFVALPSLEDASVYFSVDAYKGLDIISYIDERLRLDAEEFGEDFTLINKTMKKIRKYDMEVVYALLLNDRKRVKFNVSIDRFEKIFNECGMSIEHEYKVHANTEIIVRNTNKSTNKNNNNVGNVGFVKSPRAFINGLIVADGEDRKKNGGDMSKLTRLAEIVTAEVTGTNLKGLMVLDFLDKTRVKSNNAHIMAAVFGNEAAMALFVEEMNILLSGYGLHPQHILTIAYLFFCKGMPTGAQHNSFNKPYGPLDKATVSKAVDVLKLSALQGLDHQAGGISTGIVYGISPKIGTQYFDIAYHKEPNKIILNSDIYEEPIIPIQSTNVNADFDEALNSEEEEIPKNIIKVSLGGRKLNNNNNKKAPVQKEESSEEEPEKEIIKKSTAKKTVPKSKYDI